MLSKKIRSGLTILLLLGHPLFAQLTNDNPLFQLVAWQHTDQASLVTLLGEEAEPVIRQWEACLSEGNCANLPKGKIRQLLQTIIKENLYDSLSVTAELDRLQAALQLDTLLSPASRPGPDSVVRTSQLQPAVDGPSQPGAPASLLAAAAADIVVEIVAEEVLETAIELLQEELRKAQEVDTLLYILFPTVMLQVQQNRPEMPAQLILRQLHDALRYDFGQLDTRFPYALQQMGRLDAQSVQVVEEGTYWLEQYRRGRLGPPVLKESSTQDSFPVNEWLTFMNHTFQLSDRQPLHPVAVSRLANEGVFRALCHWWTGLECEGKSEPGWEVRLAMPAIYGAGLVSYYRFIHAVRNGNDPVLTLPAYLKTYLDFRSPFLSPSQRADAEAVLNAIGGLRPGSDSPELKRQAFFQLAEELAFEHHALLLLLGNLAIEKDEAGFKQLLRAVYLPHSNFKSMRKNRQTVLLMAYGGLNTGYEADLSPRASYNGWHTSLGLIAGPAMSFGTGKLSHTFLLQILDLGAPFSFLINEVDEVEHGKFPDKINLEAMVTPGAGYFLGLKNTPISIGLNTALVNNARQTNGVDTDVLRINVGLYLDFPLLTIKQYRPLVKGNK